MTPTAFTVYYGAALLRNGAIKTSILAERAAYDAMLSLKDELAPSSWEAIGIYTAIPTIAAWDGDTRHGSTLSNVIRATYFKDSTPSVTKTVSLPGKVYVPRSIIPFVKRTAEGATNATA
jgi:hypothetical protein